MKIRFHDRHRHPTRQGRLEVPYAPAKRPVSPWRWRLLVLLVLSPLLYFVASTAYSWLLVEAPAVLTLQKAVVTSPVTGIVARLPIRQGARVRAGEPLCRVEDLQAQERLLRLQTALTALRDETTPPEVRQRLEALEAQRRLAAEMVAYLEQREETVRFLLGTGAATLADLNNVTSRLQNARYGLLQAENELESWRVTRIVQPAAEKQRRMQELETEIAALEARQITHEVTAPAPGYVLEVHTSAHARILAGEPIATLGSPEETWFTLYLAPDALDRIDLEAAAQARLPDRSTIPVRLESRPLAADRLPAGLANPMTGRDQRLLVRALPLHPVPPRFQVEGLPVTIRFATRWTRRLDHLRRVISERVHAGSVTPSAAPAETP